MDKVNIEELELELNRCSILMQKGGKANPYTPIALIINAIQLWKDGGITAEEIKEAIAESIEVAIFFESTEGH